MVASSSAKMRAKRQMLMPALDAPAHVQEAPAGAAVHVLLRQAGQRGEDLQRASRPAAAPRLRTADVAGRLASGRLSRLSSRVQKSAGQPLAHAGRGAAAPTAPGGSPSRTPVSSCRACAAASSAVGARRVLVQRAPGDQQLLQPGQGLAGWCARRPRSPSGWCTGCGPAAGWPRPARGSGRARTGCRRRGWAGCRGCAAPSRPRWLASRVTRSTGLSAITQTSAVRASSPMEMARTSGWSEVRQKPPGMICMPSGVAAA